jgi:Gpi18-like mannosyltransferase
VTVPNRMEKYLSSKTGKVIFPIALASLFGLSLWVRFQGLNIISLDMKDFLFPWFDTLAKQGGFIALKDTTFSNYSPPYLYLLSLATYFPVIPKIIAIKSFSLFFDFICAYTAYKIARVFQGKTISWVIFIAVLLAPSVWVNSAWWGQCDSIFTAFLLLSILFLLKEKPIWAMVMFSIAFCFKFQAIFLAPFILLMFISRRIPWKWLILPFVIYSLIMLPAALFGQPVLSLLTVYLRQTDSYRLLTMSAPSIFAFFPDNRMIQFEIVGFILAALAVIIYLWLGGRQRKALTNERAMELAMISLVVLPFLLPRMHERYFYPAALFAIPLVCARPRLMLVPFVLQFTTLLSYLPFLTGKIVLPLWVLAAINLAVIIALVVYWLRKNQQMAIQNPDSF